LLLSHTRQDIHLHPEVEHIAQFQVYKSIEYCFPSHNIRKDNKNTEAAATPS
jgi:hypothetical protein